MQHHSKFKCMSLHEQLSASTRRMISTWDIKLIWVHNCSKHLRVTPKTVLDQKWLGKGRLKMMSLSGWITAFWVAKTSAKNLRPDIRCKMSQNLLPNHLMQGLKTIVFPHASTQTTTYEGELPNCKATGCSLSIIPIFSTPHSAPPPCPPGPIIAVEPRQSAHMAGRPLASGSVASSPSSMVIVRCTLCLTLESLVSPHRPPPPATRPRIPPTSKPILARDYHPAPSGC